MTYKVWSLLHGLSDNDEFLSISGFDLSSGYADKGASWREGYALEGYDFRSDIERLYNELKPFYKQVGIETSLFLFSNEGAVSLSMCFL